MDVVSNFQASDRLKTVFVTASVSRKAGGVFEAVRRLGQSMVELGRVSPSVLGVRDEHTAADSSAWAPVTIKALRVKGTSKFGYAPGMSRVLDRWGSDIVHLQGLWMYPSLASGRWARKHRRPYVISPHGMLDPWALRNARWKKWLAASLFENTNLRNCACLHALCESEAKAIRAYGLKNPICIVPNGIDLPEANHAPISPWAGTIEPCRKVVLYLGRLHPKKGLKELMQAWKMMGESFKSDSWALAVVGWDQGGHEAVLRATIADLGLEKSVFLLGPLFGKDKSAAFASCDAFVLPSFSEGLPMTVLEAWAHSKPVLMTPQCNLPEGFNANAAIRIDPDPVAISEGLLTMAKMPARELAEIGQRGKTLVSQRFTWESVARRMTAVYEWIVGSGTQPDSIILKH